jgi:anti-sigma factor RsiW
MTGFDEENLIRRFLLGKLSAEERERVGERLFTDEEFFAQVDAFEDELIDDFARGKLSAEDRERFEQQFLITDERRERLEFAQDFHQALLESHPPAAEEAVNPADDDSGVWAWLGLRRALAFGIAVSLLLIGAGALLLRQVLSRRNSREQEVATQQQQQSNRASQNENMRAVSNTVKDKDAPTNQEPIKTSQTPLIASNTQINETPRPAENRVGSRRSTVSTFAVTLEPGSLRGDGDFKKFPVPKGMKTALLKLRFEDDEEATMPDGSYSFELQNGELKTISRAENLRSSRVRGGRFVTVRVPARLLTAGNYRAVLRRRAQNGQSEGVGSYYFNVSEAGRQK